jgi:tetratricopeptide (TPR) repeat protein
MEIPNRVDFRNDVENVTAIILVHGFQGKAGSTWNNIPDFLLKEAKLRGWNIHSLGYASKLRIDLVGIWEADPSIDRIALKLYTTLSSPPFDRYKSLALVAHSMGGLVIQRALLDNPSLTSRTSHVLCYASPSGGLIKAGWMEFFKRQFRDMAADGPFIQDLRTRWDAQFAAHLPFEFRAVAGEEDEFVPTRSALGPFPQQLCRVVAGNHLGIVDPKSAESESVQILVQTLAGGAAVLGPLTSVQQAIESRDFQKAIRTLEPGREQLDPDAAVTLALAYESVGRRADALALLEHHGKSSTDAMGTLAGRLKRSWLRSRQVPDAEQALELYTQAYTQARDTNTLSQAFYNGINVAFMTLLYKNDPLQAIEIATDVLEITKAAPQDKWALATQAETLLMLDRTEESLVLYQQALQTQPSPRPREVLSMYEQAFNIIKHKGLNLENDLKIIFYGDVQT